MVWDIVLGEMEKEEHCKLDILAEFASDTFEGRRSPELLPATWPTCCFTRGFTDPKVTQVRPSWRVGTLLSQRFCKLRLLWQIFALPGNGTVALQYFHSVVGCSVIYPSNTL